MAEDRTAGDGFSLRAERPEDDGFLLELFASSAGTLLSRAGIPELMLTHLVQVQHRSRSAGYRAAYPGARFWIVEQDGRPIGRLVENDDGAEVYIVDIALVPERRAQGLGLALMRSRLVHWTGSGRCIRARVAEDNLASRRLFTRLGFAVRETGDALDLEFLWVPPGRKAPAG